jgi:hypothetical protein
MTVWSPVMVGIAPVAIKATLRPHEDERMTECQENLDTQSVFPPARSDTT